MTTFIHPLALCESDAVGEGTRIWAFAHVMRGAVVGRDCNLGEGVFVETGAVVGNGVTLKNQVLVWDGVTIGDDVFVGPGVIFTNDKAPRSPRMALVAGRYKDPANWRCLTVIGRGASLGAGAVLLPGLTIGEFAMVGAGAVVTCDVSPYRLIVGNPARPVGWVCACGGRLDERLTCPLCGARHRLAEQALVPAT
jgi:acetyltransferase-like isoleucine patch superfamily enzyme